MRAVGLPRLSKPYTLFTSAYKRAVASKCDLVRTTFMLSSVPSATTTAHHTVLLAPVGATL